MDEEKKSPTKKQYAFGTPNHQSYAFSAFSHLSIDNRDFAINLALSDDINQENTIDKKKKTHRKSPKPVGSSTDNSDGLEPCSKPGCTNVLKLIAETKFRNQDDKLELENECDRLFDDLRTNQQDIGAAENKLTRLSEVGNQLELKFNQLMVKVESLERTKENLGNERTDINNKIMVLESEKQKAQRKLEQTEKSLRDARWRKKKQDQLNNVESGLSFEVSTISDVKIVQPQVRSVVDANNVTNTGYNELSRVDVVDFNERAPCTKTLPNYLKEKLTYEPYSLDKYAKSFYFSLVKSSHESIDNAVDRGVLKYVDNDLKKKSSIEKNASGSSEEDDDKKKKKKI